MCKCNPYQTDKIKNKIYGVKGIWESYTRTFQLLLNFCEIDNIYVNGISGEENHSWNLAKMDDGNWYWFDLTWDDVPDWMWGVQYNYFCVNDTQDVNWVHMDWVKPEKSFLDTHTPTSEVVGIKLYNLPARSEYALPENGTLFHNTMVIDGLEYAWVGHNAVQLVDILKDGDISIPSNIEYQGYQYDVISIAAIKGSGLITTGNICSGVVKSVTIPASVRFIGDGALIKETLENIYVDSKNEYFTSNQGVLYTKHFYTLIQFPQNSPLEEYTISDETVRLADNSIFRSNLKTLTIGAKLTTLLLGKNNWGYGYPDSEPPSGIYIDRAGSVLSNQCPYDLEMLYIHPDNSHFDIVDGVVYEISNGFVYRSYAVVWSCKSVENVVFTNLLLKGELTLIADSAFENCTLLTSITLPDSVTKIGNSAFAYCSSLTSINFEGTVEQWNAIEKGLGCFSDTGSFTIFCTDGEIVKDGTVTYY